MNLGNFDQSSDYFGSILESRSFENHRSDPESNHVEPTDKLFDVWCQMLFFVLLPIYTQ